MLWQANTGSEHPGSMTATAIKYSSRAASRQVLSSLQLWGRAAGVVQRWRLHHEEVCSGMREGRVHGERMFPNCICSLPNQGRLSQLCDGFQKTHHTVPQSSALNRMCASAAI